MKSNKIEGDVRSEAVKTMTIDLFHQVGLELELEREAPIEEDNDGFQISWALANSLLKVDYNIAFEREGNKPKEYFSISSLLNGKVVSGSRICAANGNSRLIPKNMLEGLIRKAAYSYRIS